MPIAPINGIEICYETFGDTSGEIVLLINGFGSQLIRWPQRFIDLLTDAGLGVVVFDNRDVGLSTQCRDMEQYTLSDMANDAVGVLDHLGVERAHVVGMSMGGMIAQLVAIEHPEKVLTLGSIMSSTGGPNVVLAKPEIFSIFAEKPATNREDAIEADVRHRRIITGPGFPFDEDAARELSARVYDRCYAPDGRGRQMAAIQGAPGRVEALNALNVPAVVVHGTDDPLVPPENGKLTADAIPNATLVEVEGMGHDLPDGALEQVANAIVENARRTAASH